MKQKTAEKLEAIRLREKGYSVNEIAEKIGVTKSSISTWVRNVDLTTKARKRLLSKIKAGQLISAENKRRKTKDTIAHYHTQALKELREVKIDPLLAKIICALLYYLWHSYSQLCCEYECQPVAKPSVSLAKRRR